MKKWWKSKTIWANLLILIGLIVNSQFNFDLDPEAQAAIVVVVNLLLRVFTKAGLEA